ncbi:hypothetical protein J0A67_18655 [Algoriphagus aestuariicola]|uniref:Uncharacterized protein n=1 Tax=Algoriphagus aestuariicola TaxID=1852016 RepID=A0ABS3BX32_9BACT|nr:hypothetical protein [Algoriphagus aestuariicola]MBN7802905.1 hypothetical protein [Algoriphagus aestuariicola]
MERSFFAFSKTSPTEFEFDQSYEVLAARNLSCFNEGQFVANDLETVLLIFTFSVNKLIVSCPKA